MTEPCPHITGGVCECCAELRRLRPIAAAAKAYVEAMQRESDMTVYVTYGDLCKALEGGSDDS